MIINIDLLMEKHRKRSLMEKLKNKYFSINIVKYTETNKIF